MDYTVKTEPFSFHFCPKTPDQAAAVKAFEENDLLFFLGAAGTGKTFTAVALALREAYSGRKKKVVFVRPLVEAGEKLGFLPGDIAEKVDPFLGPLHDTLGKLAFKLPKDLVEVKTLAYMRGLTFSDCVVVVSEAQNLTYAQLKMVLTRMGGNCKLVLEGDPEQRDVSGDAFLDVVERLEGLPGIGVVDFDERFNCRHPLVQTVLKHLP